MEPQLDKPLPPERAFDASAWRFLLAERSDFLFIESDTTATRPSERLVEQVATLGQVLDERAVILIDDAQRIEAWVRADTFPSHPIHLQLGAEVRALALTPTLLRELPAWHRTSSPYPGFSSIRFETPLIDGPSPTIRHILGFLSRITSSQSAPTIRIGMDPTGAEAPSITIEAPRAHGRGAGSGDPHADIEKQIGIRERLRKSIAMLDSTSWSALRGTRGLNPGSSLAKFKAQGRLFSVSAGRRELYPQFEFGANAEPLAVIAKILKVAPADARGWPLLSWFDAENMLLGGRKPRDILREDPDSVVEAATAYYSQDDD